jgi:hypothetical protein
MITVLAEHYGVAYELEPSEPYSSLDFSAVQEFCQLKSVPIFARLEALMLA